MIRIIAFVALAAVVAFLIQRSMQRKKSGGENRKLGEAFLLENKSKPGVQTTNSGLQYLVLEAGDGSLHPRPSDKVTVHYHGQLIDGTVFDSSVQRGAPIEFGLRQVIPGWTEGLQLMVEGEKARLFIPSDLAYGDRTAGAIPPGSVLIFDVELIAINA